MVIKTHTIITRKTIGTNNGSEIPKGTMVECRVRSYQTNAGEEVSDIHILRVLDENNQDNSKYPVPDTVFGLNCGSFRFTDDAVVDR